MVNKTQKMVVAQMTAVEVLEWLKYAGKGTLMNVFGTIFCDEILLDNTPQEIIDKISVYESAKKTGKAKNTDKLMSVEFGKYLTILVDGDVCFERAYWYEEHLKSYEDFKMDMIKLCAIREPGKIIFAKEHDMCRTIED